MKTIGMNVTKVGVLILMFALMGCKNYRNQENEVIITLNPELAFGVKKLKVTCIDENILRIIATPQAKFSADTSLMAISCKNFSIRPEVVQEADTLIIKTRTIKAKINLKNGKILITDSIGNVLLSEYAGKSKNFIPITIDGKKYFSVQQVFESPDDETFYGLGQHQDGWMNYKGKDVEMYQYNSKVSVPFLVSSKQYGILWDNYSISKFGDPREYKSISQFNLYDASGQKGGLKARYYAKNDKNKVFVERTEDDINYEFLTDLKKFPSTFPMDQGLVEWIGYIESDTTGIHKFRLYAAGYVKFYFDGKLIVDRWRQAWNPTPNMLSFYMEKGKKYSVKIEWDPDGGESYIGLRALMPLPDNLQNKLSLYSEVANQIDYYFIYGNNLDEVIKGYRSITGKAPIMPKWALGFWQSRERYKTQEELLDVVAEYRKRQIPFDNIVLDWFYWPQDKWGSHDFDSTRFPDPNKMVHMVHNDYKAQIMISVWPKFYEGIENYNKMNEKGYLYLDNIRKERKDWVYPGYKNTFYDAMNPAARKLFWELLKEKLYVKGFDAWWMDATEPDIHSNLPPDERKAFMHPTFLGPAAQYFNAYPLCNSKGIYEGLRAESNKRVFILTRSAYAGQQRYAAATWSGDIGARWEELQLQIPAGLNFCISGIPYWTTDIGGFAVERKFEQANGSLLEEWREQNTRWFQYGAFCPIFRVHGQFPYREIFNIAPENHKAYKTMVYYTKMRYRLLPYIYSLAAMTHYQDYTIMRPLIMDFITDTAVYNIFDEFMFGPAFLVCPVYKKGATNRNVYLPQSNGWYDVYTGKFYAGNQNILADAPYEKIPLFVKAGSIIPVGPEIQYSLQKHNEPIDVYVYMGNNAQFYLYFDDELTYDYEKGFYAKIPLSYHETSKTLTIGEAYGQFKDKVNNVKLRIIFINANQPRALFNNTNAKLIEYKGSKIIVNY